MEDKLNEWWFFSISSSNNTFLILTQKSLDGSRSKISMFKKENWCGWFYSNFACNVFFLIGMILH